MKFVAKKVELDLVLVNLEEEERVFSPRKRVTAEFAESVLSEFDVYLKAQADLPQKEQDKMYTANLKFLNMVYQKLDTKWLKASFTMMEIKCIKDETYKGLVGVKKEEES